MPATSFSVFVPWRFGRSREATSFARLERDGGGTRADLYLNPDRDLDGQVLNVLVAYANGTTDTALLTAGPTDPSLRVEAPDPPPPIRDGLEARWLGQDVPTRLRGSVLVPVTVVTAARESVQTGA